MIQIIKEILCNEFKDSQSSLPPPKFLRLFSNNSYEILSRVTDDLLNRIRHDIIIYAGEESNVKEFYVKSNILYIVSIFLYCNSLILGNQILRLKIFKLYYLHRNIGD